MTSEGLIELNEVCDLLSISKATAINWIKNSTLKPSDSGEKRNLFFKKDIEALLLELKDGSNSKLKSRRNKNYIRGTFIPRTYIQNKKGIENVENIIAHMNCVDLPEDYERVILAEYALKLLFNRGLFSTESGEFPRHCLLSFYLQSKQLFGSYSMLIDDLLENVSDLEGQILHLKTALSLPMDYIEEQDLLGLLYMSLQNAGERKSRGVYYTPLAVVKDSVDHLEPFLHEKIRLLDPCCGTGNFLMHVYKYIKNLDGIYGYDISPLSVSLTRINMALISKTDNLEVLYKNFLCKDPLARKSNLEFDVIIGNPPWGFNYDAEARQALKKVYVSARKKTVESFAVFTEYALKTAIDGGIVSFVLPQSLLNVKIHQPLRDYLVDHAKIKRIRYWDDAFDGVQCPAMALTLQKKHQGFEIKGIEVVTNSRTFRINIDRELDLSNWNFDLTDDEISLIKRIESPGKVVYLKDHADFALGIVTGDNKRFLSNIQSDDREVIYRGSDVYKYRCLPGQNFIRFEPKSFQQIAPIDLYRAKEKLIYRFIGGSLVFAYDNSQTLTLNSANIVIPKLEGLNIKYILAILNSRVIQYYYSKCFRSVKVLRSSLARLPIPLVDKQQQSSIIEKVDKLLACNVPLHISPYYEEIDAAIKAVFDLSDKEYAFIKADLSHKNLYLYNPK